MNIKVVSGGFALSQSMEIGGECAEASLEVSIDMDLPIRVQRGLVRHAIIENFNRGMPHDKVELLCDLIQEGEDQLEVKDD